MSEKPYKQIKSPFHYSWKFFEGLIVVAAVAAAIAIWFLPNFAESDEMHAFEDAVNERKERRLAYEARQERIAKEKKELGLVYFGPGAVPIIESEE